MNYAIFSATLSQMAVLLFYVILGWILGHKNLVPESTPSGLSFLQINVFLPFMILGSLSKNFTRQTAKEKGMLILASLIITAVVIFIANVLSRILVKDRSRIPLITFSLIFTNYGFMGYPVLSAVFGEQALADMIVFAIVLDIIHYTYGASLFNLGRGQAFYSVLLRPVTIAVFLGAVIGLSGLKLPRAVNDIFSLSSNCVGINAMLLTGMILSKSKLSATFGRPLSYVISLFRLLIIPAVLVGTLYLLGIRGPILFCTGVFTGMPLAMNIVIFSQNTGNNCEEAVGHCIISSLFSLITVPVLLSVISAIM